MNVGERIQLLVSSGPAQVEVPDVTGLARDSAEQLLTDAGLEPAIEETESDKPEDEVISQNPAAGTEVDKGSRVTHHGLEGDREGQPCRTSRASAAATPPRSCAPRGWCHGDASRT